MPFYEREHQILRLLSEQKSMNNQELAAKLYISVPTLRRDLEKLESKGLILRTHGGCMLNKTAADEKIPFYFRENEQNSEKIMIAKKAMEFVKDGDIIMLDGTTSSYHLVPLLSRFKDLIVITSGAKTSYTLGTMAIKNISTGGQMITKSLSYVGPDALHTIRKYNADVAFFSCRGLSENGWLTDNSVEENDVRRAMLKHAKKKISLCDSSKVGHSYFNNLCHVSELDEVICEKELPETILKLMHK